MRFIFDEVQVILFDKKQWLRFLIYQNENNLHFFSFIYIHSNKCWEIELLPYHRPNLSSTEIGVLHEYKKREEVKDKEE